MPDIDRTELTAATYNDPELRESQQRQYEQRDKERKRLFLVKIKKPKRAHSASSSLTGKGRGWHGEPKRHAKAVLKGLRRKNPGHFIDYKPSRSKLARNRDRATVSKTEPWEERRALKKGNISNLF